MNLLLTTFLSYKFIPRIRSVGDGLYYGSGGRFYYYLDQVQWVHCFSTLDAIIPRTLNEQLSDKKQIVL